MVKFSIKRGVQTVQVDLSEVGAEWKMMWLPSNTLPDARVFVRKNGDSYEIEREFSNGSLVLGHPELTKPLIQCDVGEESIGGWSIAGPRWGCGDPTVWPMGRGSWRRYVLYQGPDAPGDQRSAAETLAAGVFRADWRATAKSFGPCNMPLLRLGEQQRVVINSQDTASLRFVQQAINSNQPWHLEDWDDGVWFPWAGWNPMGPTDPGGVGGTGIYFFRGWHQNVADLRRSYLIAQCEHERMHHWYNRADGEPISTEHYPNNPTPDVWGLMAPPEALIQNTGGDPLPPHYDFAHEIRGFGRTGQVAEQAASPMATFSLRALSSLARLRFSQRGRLPSPGYAPVNLRTLQWNAASAPGAKTSDGYVNLNLGPNTGLYGSTAGRQVGWTFFEVALTAKLCGWTAESRQFAESALIWLETAVSPTGPIQKAAGGSGNWPNVFSTQTFEDVILAYGAGGMAMQLEKPTPTFVRRVLDNIYGPGNSLPMLGNGPPHYIRTADTSGVPVQRLTEPAPNGTGDIYGDPAHAEAACALAAHYETSTAGCATWVDRGRLYNHYFPDWQQKLGWLTSSSVTSLSWEAGWVAQAQRLTG